MAVICEKCNKKTATVYMEKIINGHKIEYNLCSECAENLEDNSALDDLLKNFINMMFTTSSPYTKGEPSKKITLTCNKCGLTYDEFRHLNKLGCDHCYDVFRSQLDLIFKNIQKASIHTGKYPSRVDEEIAVKRQLNQLKNSLSKAIEEEKYEEAAILRDQIRALNPMGNE